MIILAIDHGSKNIGVAVCDELEIAARPLALISHTNKEEDAKAIANLVKKYEVEKVILGVSYTEDGDPNEAGRMAINFGRVLASWISVPMEVWDESLTTQDAIELKLTLGVRQKKRAGHHDATAAALLLQNYIDTNHDNMVEGYL